MGCGGSRLDNGSDAGLPPRLRPLLIHRMEEFRACRHAKISNSSTGSIPDDRYEEGDQKLGDQEEVSDEKVNTKEETDFEEGSTDANYEDDEDEERRIIGHDQVLGDFPGSPSFRVYFKDGDEEDEHVDLGEIKNIAFKSAVSSDDDPEPSKEHCDQNKKVKRGRKMESFRKVFPKGGQVAVKNLLSGKSRYHPSPPPHHHHHLLTRKTTA